MTCWFQIWGLQINSRVENHEILNRKMWKSKIPTSIFKTSSEFSYLRLDGIAVVNLKIDLLQLQKIDCCQIQYCY